MEIIERHHMDFIEYSPDLFWTVDANLCLIYCNEAYRQFVQKIVGFKIEPGHPVIIEGFGEAYEQKWKAYFEKALAGLLFEVEESFYNPEKQEDDHFMIRFAPIKNREGQIYAISCHSRDITQMVKLKQEAQKIMDASLDVICTVDEEGFFRQVNAASLKLWGYPPEELIGTKYMEYVLPEDQEKTQQIAEDILAGKEVTSFQNRYRCKNGAVAYNLWSARWESHENIMYCVARDGAEKRKAEEILLESESRLKALIQEGLDLITIVDESFVYTYISPTSSGILGPEPQNYLGRSPLELIHPEDLNRAKESLQLVLKQNRVEVEAYRFRDHKGGYRWLETVLTNMQHHPSIRGIVTNSRDVTRKKNEQIIHELGTKISVIFNHEADLRSALNKVAALIMEQNDFSFGEVWLPTPDKTALELLGIYQKDNASRIFYSSLDASEFRKKGESIPGKVWETGEKVIWQNLPYEKIDFTRKPAAKAAGIHYVIGIPLMHHEELTGVLLLGSQSFSIETHWHLQVLEGLGSLIAGEIAGKKMEISYTRVFQYAPVLIIIAGFDGYIKTINPNAIQLLGYTEKEILFKPFIELIHPEDKEKAVEKLNELEKGIPVLDLVLRYITKQGTIKTLSWNASPSLQDQLIYAVAKDISAEVNMEKLFCDTSRLTRIGSWEYDLINQKLLWSEVAFEIHELPPENQPDLEAAILFYREDFREEVSRQLQACIDKGMVTDMEAVIVTAKNREKWVKIMVRGELVHGKCVRVFGTIQDIEENKQNERRLKAISNNIPGVIFQYQVFTDGTDKMLHLSEGAQILWGINPQEIMENTQRLWELIDAGGGLEIVKQSIVHSAQTLHNWHCQFKALDGGGKIRWLEGLGTPAKQSDGSIIWDSVILDITQLKETEELLVSSSSLARIGSWEMWLTHNENQKMYWSPVTREILELDAGIEPTLDLALSLYKEPGKTQLSNALNLLIKTGEIFDLELELKTAKGNQRWIRCIGNAAFSQGKIVRIYGSFQDIHERKKAEISREALWVEKNNILESIGDAFFAVDHQWVVTYWNRTAEKLFQKKKKDILGKHFWEVYAEAKNSGFYDAYQKAMQTMTKVTIEEQDETTGRWFEASAYPSGDGGLSVYLKDITERKKNVQDLQAANEKFKLVTRATTDAIWDWDIENDLFIREDGFEKLFGYPVNKQMHENDFWSDSFHPDDLKRIKESLQLALNDPQQEVWQCEYRIKQKKGQVKTVSDKGIILRDEKGIAKRMIGAISDITFKKEAELKLIEANDRFEIVSQATNDAIWDWDLRNETLHWGDGFNHLFGYAHNNLDTNLNLWVSCLHPEDLSRVQHSLRKAIENPECYSWKEEYRFKKMDGSYAFVLDKGRILRDAQKKAIRMVGAMSDFTYRKNYELELLKLNQSLKTHAHELEISMEQLEQFAFIASHDLQEPLRMITSFLSQLEKRNKELLDQKSLLYIHYASDGAQRMKQIILDLLEYSRAGKKRENPEWIETAELWEEYKILRRKLIREKKVILIAENLPPVYGHKAPLVQTLHCLLDNAIKYSREEIIPEVTLHFTDKGNFWEGMVQDNGIGIDEEFYQKIFVIFQRLHNREQYEGTGIGLSIVKKHVESWGGKVWLNSEPGSGTRFYFTLPKFTASGVDMDSIKEQTVE